MACILLSATLAVSRVIEYIGESKLRTKQWHKHDLAGRVDMPSIRRYLDTSREALGKGISVAQARLSRQSGHAKGDEESVGFIQGIKGELSAFSLFLAAAFPRSEKALVLHTWKR